MKEIWESFREKNKGEREWVIMTQRLHSALQEGLGHWQDGGVLSCNRMKVEEGRLKTNDR